MVFLVYVFMYGNVILFNVKGNLHKCVYASKKKNSEKICIFVEALFYICLVLNSFTPFKYKARKDNP